MFGGKIGKTYRQNAINRNLVKKVVDAGGCIVPLLIDSLDSKGLGLCNPSIFIDNGKPMMILRNVNYTLYHAENTQSFNSRYGPLSYLNPENDIHLRTWNYLCQLNPKVLSIDKYWKIDTALLDKEPLWEFIGLEDARLVRWNGDLYGIGVRRDTTINGQGRMELSKLVNDGKTVKEVTRNRIENTDPKAYCEKNWMPILDMPNCFVKWVNPTAVVEVDLKTNTSKHTYHGKDSDIIPNLPFLRGGSQVITLGKFRLCLVHECDLFSNVLEQKDATYLHRFVIWDKDWNVVKITDAFSFMDGEIEFCCGMAIYEGDLVITFGFQDNAAYLLRIPRSIIPEILGLDQRHFEMQEEIVINSDKWSVTEWASIEITTTMLKKGCPMKCSFCPQDALKVYDDPVRILTLDKFKELIDKIPKDIVITFAGFAEPFLNKDCADMIVYAYKQGHRVSLFTTGIGMSKDDFLKIKNIPFSGAQGDFVIHLPDIEGYLKHNITQEYLELLSQIRASGIPCQAVSMGTPPEEIRLLFPEYKKQDMWWRAGNLKKEGITYNKAVIKSGPTTCGCVEKIYHNVLLPNGDVSLCCMDYGLKHIIGNLFKQDYKDIVPVYNEPFELCKYCENGVPA